MQDSRPQILIADDHVLFAEALRLLLEKSYRVVDIVGDGHALLSAAARLKPDVIVVDIGMPLLNGLDAAQQIREQLPKVKIVFLTMQDNPNLAAAAMGLGSVGFVLKHSAGSELLKAIEDVLHGKSYLTPKLRSDDWVTMKQRARQFSKELSSRQRGIVQMYAEGRPAKEIAYVLNLSQKTVEFHKRHIMDAFNLQSNADLVLFALKQGLIALDPAPATKKNAS
ncbi:MAG: response regulator transcription factor [Candidatus Korobacteraceae bacterium]